MSAAAKTLILTITAVMVLVAAHGRREAAPLLIWNATPSAPVGLYAVYRSGPLRVGDLVAARPPAPLAGALAAGRYLPVGAILIKPVAALPDQQVCRHGSTVSIDGRMTGAAHPADHQGRALPAWEGCLRVRPDEVFLMNAARSDSLDGRYFGPLPTSTVIGQVRPLWVRSPTRQAPPQTAASR